MSEPHGPAMQLTQDPPLRRCSPFTRGCSSWGRLTAFEVPAALRQLTRLDIEITVRGYGSLSPVGRPQERTEVPRRGATEPSRTHSEPMLQPTHLSRSRSRRRDLTELPPCLALARALSPASTAPYTCALSPSPSAGADVVPQVPQGASTARERRWPGFRRRRPRAEISALATIPRGCGARGRRAPQACRGVRGDRGAARLAAGAPPELGISGRALDVVMNSSER